MSAPAILSQTPWSRAVGADPIHGYHLAYRVICYAAPLTPEQLASEQARLREERGTLPQGPPTWVAKDWGIELIPAGTYDRELANFENAVIFRECMDSSG